jgi:predicted flap endonuclease-1-like 5' DNA nuclease
MQEFFMDYGLWLLIALLVIIGIVFLLSGRSKPAEPPAPVDIRPVAAPVAAPAVVPVEPVAARPVEPIAVEPEPLMAPPAPQPIPTSPAVAAPVDGADDLLRLKGVGPKLSSLLTELGVTRYAQIAGWNEADIAAIDARLGNFKGRPVRDQWVDQAKYLAAGDIAGFEAKYGKI